MKILFILLFILVALLSFNNSEERFAYLKKGDCFSVNAVVKKGIDNFEEQIELKPVNFYRVVKDLDDKKKKYHVYDLWKNQSDEKYYILESIVSFEEKDFKYTKIECPHLIQKNKFSEEALSKLNKFYKTPKESP